uniref:RING-type domain-containing protein n=1 Tax=Pelusios castaneus TaxID=367368 RepID=A0A8C8VPY3_9SAUR
MQRNCPAARRGNTKSNRASDPTYKANRQSLCKVSAFLKGSETKNFISLSLVFPAQAAMAATNPAKTLQGEMSCPICLEYFKDPVVLDCDHNFCRACITQYWEGSQTLSCPQCRQTCPEKNLRPNRHLRNIVEAREWQGRAEGGGTP